MDSYFFRVEHDLLKSQAFQELGGSAIKVYLVIGLHSNFGTGWAYPSVRTIAKQAGLSRQTVLVAIKELTRTGFLATSKSPGRSTAYRILSAPERLGPESRKKPPHRMVKDTAVTGPECLEGPPQGGLFSLEASETTGQFSLDGLSQFLDPGGPFAGPKQETETRNEDNSSIAIPGTPFRLTADGRLLVSVDLQGLLTSQGLPRRLAERLATQKDPEAVAKVLLNALYLQSQGKLQNGPGYIRTALEDGYELLPQVATRLESRRRELADRLRQVQERHLATERQQQQDDEEAAVTMLLEQLEPQELERLLALAVACLPAPLVRRNRTLSNPFVRARVYELACGEPLP